MSGELAAAGVEIDSPLKATDRERWGVVLLLLAYLLLNLLTATRYPFVWIDEVMYSDPAVNLYLGNGFTSSAWYVQPSTEFWAGNVPVHSVLLYGWIKLFGFSILSIRSINYAYLIVCCWLLWQTSLRLKLVASPGLRLLLISLVLSGYSVIFSCRSGRPDCLAMLAACLFLYAYSFARRRSALATFFILGAASPWVGLQLLPWLVVGGILLLIYLGRFFLNLLLAAWSGAAFGLASLTCFYEAHGVLSQFLRSIRQHTAIGFFGMLARGEFQHSNLIPKDFSFAPLFLLALLLAFSRWKEKSFRARSLLSFGLAFSVFFSVALLLSGKFPTYYGWMTYVPLCLCLCADLSSQPLTGARLAFSRLLAGSAIAVGIGLNLAAAWYNWEDRDYRNVETVVRENIRSSDWVYAEFGAYYATKTRAAKVFLPPYLAAVMPQEKQRISVLIIDPRSLEEATQILGGAWVDTGRGFNPRRRGFLGTSWKMGFLALQDYRLQVYRRAETVAARSLCVLPMY